MAYERNSDVPHIKAAQLHRLRRVISQHEQRLCSLEKSSIRNSCILDLILQIHVEFVLSSNRPPQLGRKETSRSRRVWNRFCLQKLYKSSERLPYTSHCSKDIVGHGQHASCAVYHPSCSADAGNSPSRDAVADVNDQRRPGALQAALLAN